MTTSITDVLDVPVVAGVDTHADMHHVAVVAARIRLTKTAVLATSSRTVFPPMPEPIGVAASTSSRSR
ncbi:hypothetical protein [Isoptericola croceus]|uniref:hypothetical protein n=1 Tax=Isoptericola croceus TaxID=3031406 RepID=UPI0023F7D616|nr:hypothetical protein [Isoptericola croceus]